MFDVQISQTLPVARALTALIAGCTTDEIDEDQIDTSQDAIKAGIEEAIRDGHSIREIESAIEAEMHRI